MPHRPADIKPCNDKRPYTRQYPDGSACFVRRSIFDGVFRCLTIEPGRITPQAYDDYIHSRGHIQHTLAALSPEEREFILSGSTPEQWDTLRDPNDDLAGENSTPDEDDE